MTNQTTLWRRIALMLCTIVFGVLLFQSIRMNFDRRSQSAMDQGSTGANAVQVGLKDDLLAIGKNKISFSMIPPQRSAVSFTYFGAPTSAKNMTEQNGGGVACLDYDADGIVDLFFTNGSRFDVSAKVRNATNTIYRGLGDFSYRDCTAPSGLSWFNFGQGVTAADYDNDGFTDLHVSAFGENTLWHNNGDGTYTNATFSSGLDVGEFSVGAAFADLNSDGMLDLYVVNYLDWSPDGKQRSRLESPMDFEGVPDRLFFNAGDGTFLDSKSRSGVSIDHCSKGLAVAIADLNNDRYLDIFVANDTCRNFLFLGNGAGQFSEAGVTQGAAISQDGAIGSSMGVAVSDYNLDSHMDLFVTNFAGEVLDVLQNFESSGFIPTNTDLGMDRVTRPLLNFGVIAADFNADSYPDLFVANGHLWEGEPADQEYRMHPTVFFNSSGSRFVDCTRDAGTYFSNRWLGRAAAMGDLDNDGDNDLVVCHLLDPPAILRNESPREGRSRRVRFIGTESCRDPLGCTVRWVTESAETFVTQIPSGGSFQATHASTLILTSAADTFIAEISICWPDGCTESWSDVRDHGEITLREGTGKRE